MINVDATQEKRRDSTKKTHTVRKWPQKMTQQENDTTQEKWHKKWCNDARKWLKKRNPQSRHTLSLILKNSLSRSSCHVVQSHYIPYLKKISQPIKHTTISHQNHYHYYHQSHIRIRITTTTFALKIYLGVVCQCKCMWRESDAPSPSPSAWPSLVSNGQLSTEKQIESPVTAHTLSLILTKSLSLS